MDTPIMMPPMRRVVDTRMREIPTLERWNGYLSFGGAYLGYSQRRAGDEEGEWEGCGVGGNLEGEGTHVIGVVEVGAGVAQGAVEFELHAAAGGLVWLGGVGEGTTGINACAMVDQLGLLTPTAKR